jgi:outer membrane receptor protein involved in Fe transport
VNWHPRSDLEFVLSAFRYSMTDIIRTQPMGDGASRYLNTGGQNGHGAEFESIWDATRRIRLITQLSVQRSTDKATGHDVGYAPRRQAFARLEWTAEAGWLFSSQLKHVAKRARAAGDARAPIADYTAADFTLRTRTSGSPWNASFSVRNAFNADVREPSLAPGAAIPNDLPMAPRSAYLEVSYRM